MPCTRCEDGRQAQTTSTTDGEEGRLKEGGHDDDRPTDCEEGWRTPPRRAPKRRRRREGSGGSVKASAHRRRAAIGPRTEVTRENIARRWQRASTSRQRPAGSTRSSGRSPNDQWTRRPADARLVGHRMHPAPESDRASHAAARQQKGSPRPAYADAAAPTRYRRDFWGWLIWRGLTAARTLQDQDGAGLRSLIPTGPFPRSLRLSGSFRSNTSRASATPTGWRWTECASLSPFNERVRYSVYSALTILAVHQHRHLWQAEQAAALRPES